MPHPAGKAFFYYTVNHALYLENDITNEQFLRIQTERQYPDFPVEYAAIIEPIKAKGNLTEER